MQELAIKKLLVANRGEIAIRVFRAATELGIPTVGIFTFEDRYSLHRYKADQAFRIGEKDDPLKPYLDIDAIIEVAQRSGANAIHPGYGFLSENSDFVRACDAAGIKFVGPTAETMDALGNKVSAKKLAADNDVPLIESSEGALESLELARDCAQKIGFPVMLKASAGGGGRGMRVVRSLDELEIAFEEASREAERAFGNPEVFLERFVDEPKHIEVQLLGDSAGNLVHLYERDCSVQRRFQKVVEVAPASFLPDSTRQEILEYALRIGRAVNYQSAGTVEFLVDKENRVYFIEVNPRIQVEHTVTEEVTGVDIVRAQILVAAGEKLSSAKIALSGQDDVVLNGHAIQCRITTENPEENFAPDYGTLNVYRSPGGFGIRLDAGSAYAGMDISPFFDSLLVKVTASGRTLQGASSRLLRALVEFRIRGVKTNIPFLQNVIKHELFQSGEARVPFIEQNPELFVYKQPRNRANRLLSYMADVVVNGNSDLRPGFESARQIEIRELRSPVLESQPGTKQKLDELGPEGFSRWLKSEKCVHFTDTTLRDAHQSLLATRVRTRDLLPYAEFISREVPELFSAEVWGGATFDVAMRFLKECPWDRLARIREAMPNTLLQMLLRGSNAVGYSAYPDNLVECFVEEAAEQGIDIFRIFDSLNWLPNMTTSIKAVRERTSSLAEVCLCYTGDILDPSRSKYDLNYYLELAKEIEDAGAHIIAIKDMAGLLKPKAAALLVSELREAVSLPIHLHTHDTAGVQSASYLEAIDAGVDVVDVAISSMSGLTSQPNFNSLLAALAGHERENSMNLGALNELSNYFEDVRRVYAAFESELKSSTAEVYEHEIPGGQYSNLRPQARALGLEEQFEDVKENYQAANLILGDLVKVTPSSKVVGDLALFMTANSLGSEEVLSKASELAFPASVIGFLRGDLGQPHGGFPTEFQAAVLGAEEPLSGRPNEFLEPIDFGRELKIQGEQYRAMPGRAAVLSRLLYPKVFEDFYESSLSYGEVWRIPTQYFFFGIEPGTEVIVELDEGKVLTVELGFVSEPDEEGIRDVYFDLNGMGRVLSVRDRSLESTAVRNQKAESENHVGSPLQGRIAKLLVEDAEEVKAGTPLFVLEAMKMESTVSSPRDGLVSRRVLLEGDLVDQGDLVIELAPLQ